MAGQDDGDGVAAERLADLARFVRRAELLGDLAVGHGLAGRDGARHLVDLAMEVRRRLEVERNVAEIDRLTREQRQNAVDGALHAGRWRRLDGTGPTPLHAGPRSRGGGFR